ncbi:MAG TPA: Zn-dependent alcohol dehydrogenase [Acidimicrobiales bacterium]
MRAAVFESVSQPLLVVDDLEVEAPGPGEVAVRVSHCGVCHSDLSLVDGVVPTMTPVVLGHEAAGIVEAVGPGVTRLQVGDHVVLTPCPPCGECYWCLRGEHSICTNSLALVTSAHPDGGTRLSRQGATVYRGLGVAAFAEVVVTQETGAVKIPDDVPLEIACVIGCAVQTGVGAVLNTAGVGPGDTVLVLGLGGVGLSVVQGARLAAATTIIVSDPVAERRELARRLGATHAIDPTSENLVATVQAITGVGVDVAFDAVGRVSLVNEALAATRSGGLTVMVGVPPLDETLVIDSPALFAFTEKKLVGCLLGGVNSPRDIPRMVDLWRSGHLDLEALITSRRPLAEINEAFEDLRASRGVRTVLTI